ncbi:MAG: YraN family protein [Lachnospiraceae bacterium]|jgi:putative endonuclease|nr:YraN family protein [Lachnospiraceae bacterium]
MNKRQIGSKKEELAAAFLREKGVQIVRKNYRIRQGEIDLIGYEDRVLIFVEVKYRSAKRAGLPEDAVTTAKKRQICKVALFYLNQNKLGTDIPCRYDVIAIDEEGVRWYKNAFEHCYDY